MKRGRYAEVTAIASRDLQRAQETARHLRIPKAYASYEALLENPDIDAIYNPLPNHLHVPWSLKALEAGKHVLCEKPVALSAAQAEQLLEGARRHPRLKVMEAFMYRFHPQEIVLEAADQYTLQSDAFSKAVLEGEDAPTPLEDAVANMRVIEGVVLSARRGAWTQTA